MEMEEEEDDFYAPNGDAPMGDDSDGIATAIKQEQQQAQGQEPDQANLNQDGEELDGQEDHHGDQDDDEEEEEEDDDDDSDIDIITERQDGTAPESTSQTRTFRGIKPEPPRTASADPAASANTRSLQQPSQQTQSLSSSKPDAAVSQSKKVSLSLQDGSKYPEVRSSSIDVESIPVWTPAGKLITEVDIDADLAEHTKPWRLPGTDQTDFFNYGFDEFTWTQYCLRQQTISSAIDAQKQETKQFEMMLAGQPGPAGPGPQPAMPMGMGMPGMPPMPDMNPEMMNAMMASMNAQGLSDPSQLDFNAFMQQMQSMGSMPQMPGQSGFAGQNMQHQNSNQGYHGQQQSGQGYGGGTPQGQSQGQQAGMEGYSAQQLAMLGGGGPPQGPSAGQRGRGRGRRW